MPIEITEEMQHMLGCRGISLESGFVETKEPRTTVFVYKTDVAPDLVPQTGSTIVKFSEKQHAIPRAKYLKLSTPKYYREIENDSASIGDELEATHEEDVRSFLGEHVAVEAASIALPSGSVTFPANGFRMFCTSLKPVLASELERMRRKFEAQCVTEIVDASIFAEELGPAFASCSSWSDVRLSPIEKLTRYMLPSEPGQKLVQVYHGPVSYSDDAQGLIESFDIHHRPTAVSFLKRRKFAWQKEYRFILGIGGEPRESELFVPISPELRRLGEIEWDAPER